MEPDDENRLVGWRKIAEYACYSERTMQDLEKENKLQIHREYRGKKPRVWTTKQAVDTCVSQHLQDLNLVQGGTSASEKGVGQEKLFPVASADQSPKRDVAVGKSNLFAAKFRFGPPGARFIWNARWYWLFGLVLLFNLGGLVWFFTKPSPTLDVAGYNLVSGPTGLVYRLLVTGPLGSRPRTIWQSPDATGHLLAQAMKRVGLQGYAALPPAGVRPRLLAERISGTLRYHDLENSGEVTPPNLSVVTARGEEINDVLACHSINWVDTPSFSGWAAVFVSRQQFPGCIVLYEADLRQPVERGRLYHPGRMHNVMSLNGKLVVGAGLNAREKRIGSYVPSLFRIDSAVFLDRIVQLQPVSPKSIPTEDRRNYYYLKDIPEIEAERYLVFDCYLLEQPIFLNKTDHISMIWGKKPEYAMYMLFDSDLNLTHKFIDEHRFSPDKEVTAVYAATRFRYWQGDDWGAWQAEIPPELH